MEIFKDIEGYEGLYQVSNLGRVKSLGNGKTRKEKVLKHQKDRYGYLRVALSLYNIKKSYLIHRLVAETFLDNPNNYPIINHKDEDKTNNTIQNLEWCTYSYNNTYGNRIKLSMETQKNNPNRKEIINKRRISNTNNPKTSKQVLCVETGLIYPSTKEIQRQFGFNNSGVSAVCLGKCKTYKGFHWQYVV